MRTYLYYFIFAVLQARERRKSESMFSEGVRNGALFKHICKRGAELISVRALYNHIDNFLADLIKIISLKFAYMIIFS